MASKVAEAPKAGAKPAVAATPAVSTPQQTASPAVFGPLPSPRTITITMVPDWNQEAIRSPLRPSTLHVVLGPANTTPEQAKWVLAINMYAMDQHRGSSKRSDEESIGKGSRALLWYDGKAFPRYHHAVEPDACKLTAADDLKTVSVVLRTFSEEKDPNALVYVRRRYGVSRSQGAGYMKVVQGHHYYLNITFAAGSTIAQMVGQFGWRPMIYLDPRGPGETRVFDPAQPTKGLLIFANFVTNWAQGVELVPDDREQRLAAQARIQDQTDEDNAKTAAAPPSQSAAASGVVTVSGVPIARTPDPSMTRAEPPVSAAFRPAAHPGPAAAAAMPVPGNPRAIAFQYALSPITINGPPLDTTLTSATPTETTYPQLEWMINTTPLPQVVIPSLDTKNYTPDFPVESTVGRFYRPDESVCAMQHGTFERSDPLTACPLWSVLSNSRLRRR